YTNKLFTGFCMVYDSLPAGDITVAGYYFWDTTAIPDKWVRLATGANWQLTGNAGTTAGTNFIGTIDNKDFVFKTNNTEWARITSSGNVGIGTTTPTNLLSLSGTAAQTIWMERNATANTTGNTFTIQAGGATLGATNKNGGALILKSGVSTGTGAGDIQFWTSPALTIGQIISVDATPTLGGTGYTVGDILTITTGGTGGAVTVATVNAGVIQSLNTTPTWVGTGYSTGTGKATTGGTGSGATINITAVNNTTDDGVMVQRMTILGNGNIGIRTNTPTHALEIKGGGSTGLNVIKNCASGGITNDFTTTGVLYPRTLGIGIMSGYGYSADIPVSQSEWYSGFGGYIGLWSDVNGGVEGGTNVVGVVSIPRGTGDGSAFGYYTNLSNAGSGFTKYGVYSTGETYNYFSGKLGIGTNTSQDALHVVGNIQVSYGSKIGSITDNGALGSTTASGYIIPFDGAGNMYIVNRYPTGTNGNIFLQTSTLTRVTIDKSGNVGIGTTTPSEKLEVCGNVKVTGTIRASGTITGSQSITCSSDIRYKKDITTLTNSLANVLQLRGVNYKWKKDEFPEKQFTEGNQIGFIAQELEKVYPEVVFTDKDGYKSLDYSRLTSILVEAIKEQQKMIDSIKLENNQLKAQNTSFSNKFESMQAKIEIQQTKFDSQQAEIEKIKQMLDMEAKK
ncbi:MAG: hypothetical protein HGB12_03600, partial [Bacteroidetes bacterium]|nr:hypothetical protein [Bacteroidota bacterium]